MIVFFRPYSNAYEYGKTKLEIFDGEFKSLNLVIPHHKRITAGTRRLRMIYFMFLSHKRHLI